MEPIRLRLREWREHIGLTQRELSERSGVAQDAISELETGKRRPYPRTLAKLGAALAIPPHALWSEPPAALPPAS
jgi:transcriptional regulator with XRE-family HTH domain